MPDGSSLPEIKISQLPVGTSANLTDMVEVSQTDPGPVLVSRSVTVAQIAALSPPPDLSDYVTDEELAAAIGAIPPPPTTLPPSGPAGGDLSGTYPNPRIKPSATNGQVMTTVSGVAAWAAAAAGGGAPTGPAGGDLSGTYPNPTINTAGTLANYLPLAGGQLTAPAVLGWTGKTQLSAPADGNFLLRNNAGASFGTLQLGGTTNAFPGLFRSGNAISVVLADGSNYATLNANNFNTQNGLFFQTFGSITSPGVDGQFEFFNNAGTAASRLDIATDGTAKFKNRLNTDDAIVTMKTMPGTQNDNSGATTAWVKAALAGGSSITVSDTPPASPGANMLWWNSVLGTLFIYYNDGNSTQWVPASPSAPNKLLQEVTVETGAQATGTTLIPFDDTIPQITEGDQYMTLSITPQSATSKLIIEVICVAASSAVNNICVALFQDATANALAAVNQLMATATALVTIPLRHVMTSGTTNATTFRVRMGGSTAGTLALNGTTASRLYGGVMASSIVIREIAP